MTKATNSQNQQEASDHPPIHVWANPPSTAFPLRRSPVRIAVGTPFGASTNSWKVWVHGNDTYVTCRDNFRELKVSLHASGIWRVAFTETFAKSNPEFVPLGSDRVWKKWTPILDSEHPVVIGFQVVCLASGLYLQPPDRDKWPKTVVFAEAPNTETEMAVLSICVVQSQDPVGSDGKTRGAVIAVLPLGDTRTVQVIITHEKVGDIPALFIDGFKKALGQQPNIPAEGIFLLHGDRGSDIPWIGAVPYRIQQRDEGTQLVQPNTR